MSDIEDSFKILCSTFKNFKIDNSFGISDDELKKNLSILIKAVLSPDLNTSNKVQQYLFYLSGIDQDAFLTSFLFLLKSLLQEKIDVIDLTKSALKIICEKNKYTEEDYITLFKDVYSVKNTFTIGEPLPHNFSLTEEDAICYYDIITNIVQHCGSRLNKQDNKTNLMHLNLAYNCIKIAKREEVHFYHLSNLVIQIMNHTQDYQLARNIVEQIFQLSINNGNGIYGFYLKADCYLMQKNLNDALIYLTIVLYHIDENIPFDLWKLLLTRIQIFYREISAEDYEKELYILLQSKFNLFDTITKDQVTLTHFGIELKKRKNISKEVYDYLSNNKEEIESLGKDGYKVWYTLLFQIYQYFHDDSLKPYLEYYEKQLPETVLNNINNSLGKIENDKDYINSIVKSLIDSKYNSDRNSEIKRNLRSLHILLEKSFKTRNSDLFINVNRLLSGLDFIASEDDYEGLVAVSFEKEEIVDYYQSLIENFNKTTLKDVFNIIFIGKTEDKIFIHIIKDNEKNFIELSFNFKELIEYIDQLPEIMFFDDKDSIETEIKRMNDQIYHSSILNLDYCLNKPYIVITDSNLSCIPNNLFVSNHSFLSIIHKSLSMPSLDFLINSKDTIINNQISLWCPSENGDMPMNYALKGILPYLEENSIYYETSMDYKKVNFSDISIIIAHGGKDISHKLYFMAGGAFGIEPTYYMNINNIIKEPKLVILFICHSGKAEKNMLYETSESMQNLLFQKGAQAVIAPKWPLHTSIPGIWLPKFIDTLKNGKTSFEAFSEAQDYISLRHPNAGAWACLHYFGNPNIKIK